MRRWDLTISKLVLDAEKEAFCRAIPGGAAVEDRRAALVLWLLINTGLRVSEVCGLRVCDCPSELGALYVEVHRGKRGKSRNVPVSAAFAEYIAAYIRQVRPGTLPKRFAKSSRKGWLLFDRRGRKLTRYQVYRLVAKTARRAGIGKRITPHMWRHRFATRALTQDGSNIYRVKSWMGHNSLAITEKYLHLAGMLDGVSGETLDQMTQRVRAV